MKKYRELYKEEKRRHEEALQKYRKNHVDEIENISLHISCSKKARKVPHPKKAPKSSKSDEPKKVPGSSGFIRDPSKEEQRAKMASRSGDGKDCYRDKENS